MSNKAILSRYEKDQQGNYILNVSIPKYKSLYDDFDKTMTSFLKKDLDEDFVNYIIECASEIGTKRDFIIRLDILDENKDELKEIKIKESFQTYFSYLIENEKNHIGKMIRKSVFNMIMAFVFIFFSMVLYSVQGSSLFDKTIVEGFNIVAWVAMWQVMENVLFDWRPSFEKIKVYKTIKEKNILFKYLDN